jgi:hypothetical protein
MFTLVDEYLSSSDRHRDHSQLDAMVIDVHVLHWLNLASLIRSYRYPSKQRFDSTDMNYDFHHLSMLNNDT